jgi:hypothetical protein
MLTHLKTYLHELASDKKNWLILLPAMATLDLFLPFFLPTDIIFAFFFLFPYEILFLYLFFVLMVTFFLIFYAPSIKYISISLCIFWLIINALHLYLRQIKLFEY